MRRIFRRKSEASVEQSARETGDSTQRRKLYERFLRRPDVVMRTLADDSYLSGDFDPLLEAASEDDENFVTEVLECLPDVRLPFERVERLSGWRDYEPVSGGLGPTYPQIRFLLESLSDMGHFAEFELSPESGRMILHPSYFRSTFVELYVIVLKRYDMQSIVKLFEGFNDRMIKDFAAILFLYEEFHAMRLLDEYVYEYFRKPSIRDAIVESVFADSHGTTSEDLRAMFARTRFAVRYMGCHGDFVARALRGYVRAYEDATDDGTIEEEFEQEIEDAERQRDDVVMHSNFRNTTGPMMLARISEAAKATYDAKKNRRNVA